MGYQLIKILIVLLLVYSCNSSEDDNPKYKLVSQQEGILIEEYDSTITDISRFNWDNQVFVVGTEFTYDYKYIKSDTFYKFKFTDADWEFVPTELADSSTVTKVKLTVLPMIESFPFNPGETLLSYHLEPKTTFSITSVIENRVNIWLHPPREALFSILELNPFPYVKFPIEIGKRWDWELSIGDHYGDNRWKTWSGRITNSYNYEVIRRISLDTNFGKLECYEIQSKAVSELGTTSLKSWFNEEFGFVKLKYVNIDQSILTLTLVDKKNNTQLPQNQ